MEAEHDLALIFTALDTEMAELADSLKRFLDNVDGISSDFICVAVIQQTGADTDLPMPAHSAVEIVTTLPRGVSAARNVGLRAASGRARRVMFVDCRTVLSRPFCRAAFSESARQRPLWSGMVDWRQMPGAAHLAARERSEIDPVHIAYEGFLWRCIFHVELVDGCSFREDIGPGTQSRIQSGEDCLFMRDIIVGHGLRSATIDTSAMVERLPRANLDQKRQRYAFGDGYKMGQLLRASLPLQQRWHLIQRWAGFLIRTAQLGLSWSAASRSMGRDRLNGLFYGLRAG